MIEKIKGNYLASTPKGIVVDVNGVGYGLEIPLSAHAKLPQVGEEVELWVHTHVREDAIKLFGFNYYADRIAFEILIGLSGVGPKVALAILSTLSVEQLKKAIMLDRQDVLLNVPGIGKRLAEKIFVDLKSKLKKLNAAAAHEEGREPGDYEQTDTDVAVWAEVSSQSWAVMEDVRSALENLGFKDKSISSAMDKLAKSDQDWTFQELMRESLALLGSHKVEGFGASKQQTLDKLF